VRIAAAEVLAKYGDESTAPVALELLMSAADLRQTDYYNSVRALNALDDLREKLTSAQCERLSALPRTRAGQSARTRDYADRLLTHILGE